MGVSRVNGMESVDAGQMAMAQAADSVSKSIQNQITSVQRKMQEISAKEDISVEEKMKRRQELQKEISSLNTKLRQHEAEVRKEQQAKAAAANNMPKSSGATGNSPTGSGATGGTAGSGAAGGATGGTAGSGTAGSGTTSGTAGSGAMNGTAGSSAAGSGSTDGARRGRTDGTTGGGTAEDKSVDTGMSQNGMRAMVSADSSMEHARRQGTVVSRIEGGIGILKAEIKQDAGRDIEVERKQQELARMEERARRASEAQFSILGDAHQTMKEAAKTEQGKTVERNTSAIDAKSTGNTFFSATNLSKEKNQNLVQRINFSVDI